MKRVVAFLCIIVLIIPCTEMALASNHYIIPDSNTRRLTREELWTWQYDALGYIFNEIFARHGYHFEPGGKYDNYFRSQLWYQENPLYDNQGIYKNLVTNIEWYNERLAKQVREEMRALGTTNPAGKALPVISYEPEIYGAFSQFQRVYFAPNQKLPVYSGPGTHYHRSANGKALASTNGHIYVGGWENGWLMIMYWTNDYNVRVGFTQSSNFKDKIDVPHLRFAYEPATITRRVALTDDPVASYQSMATLEAGTQVTYLTDAYNEKSWAYVEATVGGTLMRGYVEAGAVDLLSMQEDEPSYAPAEVVSEDDTNDRFVERSFWGLTSSSTEEDVLAVLDEKGIQYEVERSINIKEDQPITMFGIPVELDIRCSGSMPKLLTYIEIYTIYEWEASDPDTQIDEKTQQALDTYVTMIRAVEDQYGPPTGGYLTNSPYNGPKLWNYPKKDGFLDLEIIQSALKNEGGIVLETFTDNIEVLLLFRGDASSPYAYVSTSFNYGGGGMGYIGEYDPPIPNFTGHGFEHRDGEYSSAPQTIEIDFGTPLNTPQKESQGTRIDPINLVKTGRIDGYGPKMVGEAFESIISGMNWDAITGTDGNTYVNMMGTIPYAGRQARICVQYKVLDDSRFVFSALTVDGEEYEYYSYEYLLDAAYGAYDSGSYGSNEDLDFSWIENSSGDNY